MVTRWSSVYTFHWAPVLTFSERRTACLQWFESNLDVLSFMDVEDEFGVSAEHRGLRVVVSRRGMDLLLGAPGLDAESAEPLVRGVLRGFQPRDLHLHSSRALFSIDIEEEVAADAASLQAQAWFAPRSGYRAWDFATLMDIATPGADMKVEFGVVDAEDLRLRLTHTDLSRIRVGAEMPAVSALPRQLPAAAYFFDVSWVTTSLEVLGVGDDADSVCDFVRARLALSDHEAATVVEQIAANMDRRGRSGELTRGA